MGNRSSKKELFSPIQRGDIKKVKKILKNNTVRLDKKNDYGETVLMCAVNKGNYEITKILVENGANINASNNYNTTVLMYAASLKGNYAIVKFLLSRDILNVLQDNSIGATALSLAQKNEDHFMIDILENYIDSKVDANINKLGYELELTNKLLSDYLKTQSERNNSNIKLENNSLVMTFDQELSDNVRQRVEFCIQQHREYMSLNSTKNISVLIKNAPVFGDTFIFYTSSTYTFLDSRTVSKLIAGESFHFPRTMKCTWYTPALDITVIDKDLPIFLVLRVKANYLFISYNYSVYLSARFLNVEKVFKYENYIVVHVTC
jgi:FOG: Ankyrin repeat